MDAEEVREHYLENQEVIEDRLDSFRDMRSAEEDELFRELVFVILTSQTQARNAWDATLSLENAGLLEEPVKSAIEEILAENEVQYEKNKTEYITDNRRMLSQPTLQDPSGSIKISDRIDGDRLENTREWLVENISGLGWKGGSHFLRNIGYGNGFAIISSRISGKMYELGLLESPEPPSEKEEYLNTEEKLREFCEETGIEIKAMDLVLWSMETGEVFK